MQNRGGRMVVVAAIQFTFSDFESDNLHTLERLIREAHKKGANIVLIQDLFEGHCLCEAQEEDLLRHAKPYEGNPTIIKMRDLAEELGVVIPVTFFEVANDAYYNSVVVIDAGGTNTGLYRKPYIPDGPGYQWNHLFNPRDINFKVFTTKYAKIGVGICSDQWFPQAARAMAEQGAEMLLYPTANGYSEEPKHSIKVGYWKRIMLSHAGANMVPLVASNRIGTRMYGDSKIEFYGNSIIAGPTGRLVAIASKEDEQIIVAQFDLDEIERERILFYDQSAQIDLGHTAEDYRLAKERKLGSDSRGTCARKIKYDDLNIEDLMFLVDKHNMQIPTNVRRDELATVFGREKDVTWTDLRSLCSKRQFYGMCRTKTNVMTRILRAAFTKERKQNTKPAQDETYMPSTSSLNMAGQEHCMEPPQKKRRIDLAQDKTAIPTTSHQSLNKESAHSFLCPLQSLGDNMEAENPNLTTPNIGRGETEVSDVPSSTGERFDLHEDPSFWEENNIHVIVRIRPLSGSEMSAQGQSKCIRQESYRSIAWVGNHESRYTFDLVAGENVSQETLFKVVGMPIVDNCIAGYNSCLFAYGQTGSGKTYTMLGDIENGTQGPNGSCGMAPRMLEYLFSKFQKEKDTQRDKDMQFTCSCSFLEIYNDQIFDLLHQESTNLQIREDSRKGIYVERLTKQEVPSARDAMQLLIRGAANRKVGETKMNRESSRSHCIFTCVIESKWDSQGRTHRRFAHLNLVDLAGSERQKRSCAEGVRLKEASMINSSLTNLRTVIEKLSSNKKVHVPYRDSKLTFLLRDSLGGNSKTTMIANISPSNCSSLESRSTLEFAKGVKLIKNEATVNEGGSGDELDLHLEIRQLKKEVEKLKCMQKEVEKLKCMQKEVEELRGLVARFSGE